MSMLREAGAAVRSTVGSPAPTKPHHNAITRVEPHCLHQTPGQRVERNSEAYSANSVSLIFLQNRGRVHLQSAKHERSDGFSDVMLIKAYSRISKLYEAGEKTQNL